MSKKLLTPKEIKGEQPIQKYTLEVQGKETYKCINRSKIKDIINDLVLTETEEISIKIRRAK